MKVIKIGSQETYFIQGKLPSPLIPRGANIVNVDYDGDGRITNVFYNRHYSSSGNILVLRRRMRELDAMNATEQSVVEKRQVVGLLKKLARQ